MRVVQCIWRMSVGGTEGQLLRLATALVRRGIDLHIVTASAGEYDAALPGQSHRVASWFKYDPSPLLRLGLLFRRLQPDIVHTFLTQMDIIAGMTAATLRIPWMLSERSTAEAYPPMPRHRLRIASGRRADAIVANSLGGADYWRSVAPNVSRIRVIPNIVPVAEIEAALPVDDAALGDVVLFAGRFSAEKNLFTLMDALALLLREKGTTAVMCGDGPLRVQVEQKARDLGIASRVRFLGNVSNVWSWMKRAAAVVSVSTFEGNPNVVLEAAAAGAPLLLSDIAGHRAVFADDAALYVDGSSAQSICNGIVNILTNRVAATNRAEQARRGIGSRSADEIAARYEQVYREILEG
jgi:glycosyltransferase involved in cell wall biosynthesis